MGTLLFSPLWMGDEMYHVKHLTPTVLGKFDAVNVYIPDQLPAVSDLTSTGIPAWWRTVCWNSLSARRPPDVPASGNVCCSFGAQVPPHLLSSCWHTGGGSFYLSKDLWCIFSHMVLHFLLFWQPNTIQQPISGPRLSPSRTTEDKQAVYGATTKLVRLVL